MKIQRETKAGWSQVKMKAVLHNEAIKMSLQKLTQTNLIMLLLINLLNLAYIKDMYLATAV